MAAVVALFSVCLLPPAGWRTRSTAPLTPKRPSAVAARRTDEFTVTEVAARLNLPEGTVYNWLYKGRLPARRVVAAWHTLWLVRLEEVEAFSGSGQERPDFLPDRPHHHDHRRPTEDTPIQPGSPIWLRPTRPKATETLAESRIPAFTRRVRQDSTT